MPQVVAENEVKKIPREWFGSINLSSKKDVKAWYMHKTRVRHKSCISNIKIIPLWF
jgi:hypothetical protein